MQVIRILLVDDHEVVRTGLRSYLETQPDFVVVGEACNGREALTQAAETRPDVIVMDITMPEMDGLEATRRLAASYPGCRVLALTIHADKQYFFKMITAGAAGYLTKQAAAQELAAAIRAMFAGSVYLQPALASWLLEDYRRLATEAAHSEPRPDRENDANEIVTLDVLSKRELQVLEMVARGLTTPQIADQLELSPKTVSRHRERIMNKLNMHSTTELVKFAIRTGLIAVE